jgi:hypothetical protein
MSVAAWTMLRRFEKSGALRSGHLMVRSCHDAGKWDAFVDCIPLAGPP